MLVAMPVESENVEAAIYPSFGRAPYFLLYDVEREKSRFIDNGAVSAGGGAGVKAAQVLADAGVSALLAPRCGENAADVLRAAGVTLYRAAPGSALENIASFRGGRLPSLEDIHPGFHGREGA